VESKASEFKCRDPHVTESTRQISVSWTESYIHAGSISVRFVPGITSLKGAQVGKPMMVSRIAFTRFEYPLMVVVKNIPQRHDNAH
jgi:hypothetical protein